VVDGPAAEQAGLRFGGLLRQLRDQAGLTQEELAEAARVSQRAVSDLERGVNATARKDTAVLLAAALGLDGPARDLFIAAARGRVPAGDVLAAAAGAAGTASAAAASRTLPRDIAAFTGRQDELGQLMARWADDPRWLPARIPGLWSAGECPRSAPLRHPPKTCRVPKVGCACELGRRARCGRAR
jgi:transcriptional regulator with XRE-family HTH domain